LASFRFCETQYLLLLHACSATVLCLLGGLMQVLLPKRRGRYADFDINLSIPNLSLFSLANPTVYSSLTPHGKATPKQLPSQDQSFLYILLPVFMQYVDNTEPSTLRKRPSTTYIQVRRFCLASKKCRKVSTDFPL